MIQENLTPSAVLLSVNVLIVLEARFTF